MVAVNDLTSPETLAHLLRYDSTHGRFDGKIEVAESSIVVDSVPIAVLSERDPKALPVGSLGVDVVVESTGLFTSRSAAASHLEAGAPPGDHLRPGEGRRRHLRGRRQRRRVRPGEGLRGVQRLAAPPTASCRW